MAAKTKRAAGRPAHIYEWLQCASSLWERYAAPFAAAYVLALIVYSYLFTTVLFTNHTFPNVWMRTWPSGATWYEGRWFSDIVFQLVGAGGVQAFQMAVGCGLQIVNGFLFAYLLRITGGVRIFLIAAFVVLHPAMMDYYAFTSDHTWFIIGDTFVLLGVIALDRFADRRLGVVVAALCFMLTLASYQPKIALIGVLLLVWCIEGALRGDRQDLRSLIVERIVLAGAAFTAGLVAYYISSKIVIVQTGGARTNLNDLSAIVEQLWLAYPKVIHDFTHANYMHRLLWTLPAIGVALGTVVIAWQAFQRSWQLMLAVIVLIALFPLASQLSYIINDKTWQGAGRILSPQVYLMLFFLVSAWAMPRFREVSTAIVVVMLYYFAVVGSQETNAAALKTVYDIQKLNRVVARIETVVPQLGGERIPLVVIGGLGRVYREHSVKTFPNRLYGTQYRSETFAPYRQIEFLDFFLGGDYFRNPTKDEADLAIASAKQRRAWPASESVYMQDGVLVVLLQPYRPGAPVTWWR